MGLNVMLSLPIRLLLRNAYTIERIPASCKCSDNGKPNIIKVLNAENKYIYGTLLETQKQRRKRINKITGRVPNKTKQLLLEEKSEISTNFEGATENKKPLLEDELENSSNVIDETENKKGLRKRKKKTNTSEIHTDLNGVASSLTSDIPVASTVVGVINQNLENRLDNKISSRIKTKKVKSSKSSTDVSVLQSKNKVKNNTIIKYSDEFIFKSSVPIDEINYPLQNPEKPEISNQDCPLENVLNYSFTDPLTKSYSKFPSVSKIMEETMPERNKMILNKWRKTMIAEMGEEGFNKYNAGLKKRTSYLRNRYIRNNFQIIRKFFTWQNRRMVSKCLKMRGSEFHLAVRKAVLGETAGEYSEVTAKALQSLAWMLPHVSRPVAVESIVGHPKLEYKGIPDCVAAFRDIPVLIDWKLSDKPKKELKDTYEAPVQISAYIGALNHDPNYKWGVSHGLVAVAYTSGDPCDVFLLAPQHCQIYWRHWLMRFDRFKARSHLHVNHDINEAALGIF